MEPDENVDAGVSIDESVDMPSAESGAIEDVREVNRSSDFSY